MTLNSMIKVVTAVINKEDVVEVITDSLEKQPGMKECNNFWEAVSEYNTEVILSIITYKPTLT